MTIQAQIFAGLREMIKFINDNAITQTQVQLMHHVDNTGGYVLVWWE